MCARVCVRDVPSRSCSPEFPAGGLVSQHWAQLWLLLALSRPRGKIPWDRAAEMCTERIKTGPGIEPGGFSSGDGSCLNFGFPLVLIFEFEARPGNRKICNYNSFLSCYSEALK